MTGSSRSRSSRSPGSRRGHQATAISSSPDPTARRSGPVAVSMTCTAIPGLACVQAACRSGVTVNLAIGDAPMRSCPAIPTDASRPTANACSALESVCRARSRKSSPTVVRSTLRVVRSKSWTPSCCSSWRIALLSAGCATCSSSAALRKLSAATTHPLVGVERPAPAGGRGREYHVFAAATAVAVLHAVDDAWLSRQPGVGVGQHALAGMISLAAGIAAIVAFARLRAGCRAAIALIFGVLAMVNGTLHLIHLTDGGPSGSDVTGVLALAAGVVLTLLGLAIPFVHRGEGGRRRTRRWVNRAVAAVAGVLVVYGFVLPTSLAIIDTHQYREPIGSPPSAEYERVSFASSDGLELSGWYHPSRNRAAVVVVHGAGGDRTGAVAHAELLARHGFGVLVYDSRGRGESDGSPVGFGWGWPKDVAGALAFLRERPDVDPERIGGLGLSRGADVLIQVAAEDKGLKGGRLRRRNRWILRRLPKCRRRGGRRAVLPDDVHGRASLVG